MKLDQKSLDLYEEKAGIAVSNALDRLLDSNSYQILDDQDKKIVIDKLVESERKKVRSSMKLDWTPDMGYTKSSDSPTGLKRVSLYGKSVVTDPKQTINAVLEGNPIRKVEGGAVILERKNSLGAIDQGNKATEVDHKIALTLGGTNTKDNLQILTKDENRVKGAFETYLYKEMKAGRITKEEAQKKDLNWRNEVGYLPKSEQTKIVNSLKPTVDESSGKVYQIINDSGTITTIDLSKPIEYPTLTGYDSIDKELKSSYKSALTTRKKNVIKLLQDGQITAEEANSLIGKIETKQKSIGKGKVKKIKLPKIKVVKIKVPKIKVVKIKVPKLKKPKKIKIKKPKKVSYKKPTVKKIKLKKID